MKQRQTISYHRNATGDQHVITLTPVVLKSAISVNSAIDRYYARQGAQYGEHGRLV